MSSTHMRKGFGEVNGEMKEMSFSPAKVEIGEMWQTLRGEWRIAVEYHGKFDTSDGPAWGYTVRPATQEEIANWTQPAPAGAMEDFWADFDKATDYIR